VGLLVDQPAAEKAGNPNKGNDPEPNGWMHSIDTDQGDEDGTAGAPEYVGDKEAAW